MLNINSEDVIIEQDIRERSAGEETPVFERLNTNLYGAEQKDLLNRDFLRKYVCYAKKLKPAISKNVIDLVADKYSDLRQKGDSKDFSGVKKLPITVRTLETIIRLGTAHAKLRLSPTVDTEDVENAAELLNFAIFNEDDAQEPEEIPMDIDDQAILGEFISPNPKRQVKEGNTTGSSKLGIESEGELDDDEDEIVDLGKARKRRDQNKQTQSPGKVNKFVTHENEKGRKEASSDMKLSK